MSRIIIALSLLFIVSSQFSICSAATPPPQPQTGPGGQQYAHSAVTKTRHGSGATEYWLYEPDLPKPHSAPVIVFLHGYGAMNPMPYGAWLEHLVKRGNIVIYPRYQKDIRTPLKDLTPNAIDAIRSAIDLLQSEKGHVKPDLSKFAAVGHSAGGVISANVATLAKERGLPEVLALMPVQPGRTWNPAPRLNIPLEDLSKLPEKTLLLSVVGDKDTLARDTDAKRIYYESVQIPANNKDFVTLVSDTYGNPALNANHFAPNAPDKDYDNGESKNEKEVEDSMFKKRLKERLLEARKENLDLESDESTEENLAKLKSRSSEPMINAIDFYGTWKLFDGLCDAAFFGRNRNYALGNTPEQRFMGVWSDGHAVKELMVTDMP